MKMAVAKKKIEEDIKDQIYMKTTSLIGHMGEGAWNKKINNIAVYFDTDHAGKIDIILDWIKKNKDLENISSTYLSAGTKKEIYKHFVKQVYRFKPFKIYVDLIYSNDENIYKEIELERLWEEEKEYKKSIDEAQKVMEVFDEHGFEPEYNVYQDHYSILDPREYDSEIAKWNGDIEYRAVDINGNTENRFIITFSDYRGLRYSFNDAVELHKKLGRAIDCLEDLKIKFPQMVKVENCK